MAVVDHTCDLLNADSLGPGHRELHWLVRDGDGRQRALLTDTRRVDGGLAVELRLRPLAGPVTVEVAADVATDLGDLLTFRYGEAPPPRLPYHDEGDALVARGAALGATVAAPTAQRDPAGRLRWSMTATRDSTPVARVVIRPRPDRPGVAPDVAALRVSGDHRWERAVASAHADLAALRMHDPEHGLSWVAAGAPWYMALFGRDALLTAYEALVVGTAPALDVLEALAHFQGTTHDPRTGKVLHELRTGHSGVFGLAPWEPYYGSVDASPLFVVALAEAWRWGADRSRVAALLPAARRAVAWCRDVTADDAHGHLSYDIDAAGLANQGWKDSVDAMVHADGTAARPPIAVVEAQAYLWRALRDLADPELHVGDAAAADDLRASAADLRDHVLTGFRSSDDCVIAMARDADGRRLDVASSNAGHLL